MTLRVMAFVTHPECGASSRYRVYQWRETLRAHGIQLDVAPFFDERSMARLYVPGRLMGKSWDLLRGTAHWIPRLRAAGRYDLALVHRELWPLAGEWPLAVLRRGQPRWIYDLDDAVYLPNVSAANRRFVALKSHHTAPTLAAGARGVVAGNEWLAAWARSMRPGRPAGEVEVVPTVVDTRRWLPAPSAGDEPVRLVWTGSPSTVRYLAAWGAALERVGARHPGLELHVVGARLTLSGLRCVSHAWSEDTEPSIVGQCHVGLAPLADGDWERGKCGLKLLLYMARGLAAIASRSGVHPEIVTPGEDGLLVEGGEELEVALERLVEDAALRRALGRAARATVERRYSMRAVAPRFADVFRRAAESA